MRSDCSSIPEGMRSLHRWVCADPGSKRPMRCFERVPASVSKPDTWGTFEEAAERVEAGDYAFLGFVFADDGLVGVDIDDAFDCDGMLTEEALATVRAFDSYTEVSKSGNGLHIVCRGSLPFRGRNDGRGFEVYRDARYFVMTGWRFGRAEGIRDAQEAIDALVTERFPDVTESSQGGTTAPKIWAPEWRTSETGVVVDPVYPDVPEGSRHLSLVSFCGQRKAALASRRQMLREAVEVNARRLTPPLPESEVRQVVDSVARYRR